MELYKGPVEVSNTPLKRLICRRFHQKKKKDSAQLRKSTVLWTGSSFILAEERKLSAYFSHDVCLRTKTNKRTLIPGMKEAEPHTERLETYLLNIHRVVEQNNWTDTCFLSWEKLCCAIRHWEANWTLAACRTVIVSDSARKSKKTGGNVKL